MSSLLNLEQSAFTAHVLCLESVCRFFPSAPAAFSPGVLWWGAHGPLKAAALVLCTEHPT